MPQPVANPPAYVQQQDQPAQGQAASGGGRFVQRGASTPGEQIDVPVSNALNISLHGVKQDRFTGEVTAQSISGAFRQSVVGNAQTNLGPNQFTPQQFGQFLFAQTPSNLQLSTPNMFEQALTDLGINQFDFIVRLDGAHPMGSFVSSGELFTQRFDFAGPRAQYSITGEPLREFFEPLTNGRGEVSSIMISIDGNELAFAPCMRIPSVFPGVHASVSASVGRAFNSTERLTPMIGDGLFAPPTEQRDPLKIGAGRLFINSYQFPQDSNSLATRFDFQHDRFEGSLLVATGIGESEQAYNFIALRGNQWFSPQMTAQGDLMYAQRIGGGHGIGGEFSLLRKGDRSVFGFGAGFHHYFDGATPGQAGGWDTNIPQILGTDPSKRTEFRGGFQLSW